MRRACRRALRGEHGSSRGGHVRAKDNEVVETSGTDSGQVSVFIRGEADSPLSSSLCRTPSSMGTCVSWYSGRFRSSLDMYKSTQSYRDFGILYRSFFSG